MKNAHVLDDLSAYLDGEAVDSDRIARHLRECAACGRRYEELRALSARLQALPAPEVRPEFLTRVMACVAETEMSARSWWVRWSVPAVLAAAVLALIAGAYVVLRPATAPQPTPNLAFSPPATTETPQRPLVDAQRLAEEDLLAEESDAAESAGPEELVAALSDTDWFSAFIDDWESQEDLETVVGSLSESETAILKDLIRTYAEEEPVL